MAEKLRVEAHGLEFFVGRGCEFTVSDCSALMTLFEEWNGCHPLQQLEQLPDDVARAIIMVKLVFPGGEILPGG